MLNGINLSVAVMSKQLILCKYAKVCGGLNVLVYNQGLSDAIDIVKRGGVK